jgi:hypothetical protein
LCVFNERATLPAGVLVVGVPTLTATKDADKLADFFVSRIGNGRLRRFHFFNKLALVKKVKDQMITPEAAISANPE